MLYGLGCERSWLLVKVQGKAVRAAHLPLGIMASKPLAMASGVVPQPVDEEVSKELADLNPHVGSNLPM